ncbi:MAG: hypothetical protein HGB36_13975 [Chlorobiaceae bacterium]|nr:hypothetical protein [Chlorobiaceae bacterium]
MTLTREPATSGTSTLPGCSPKPKPNVMKNQVETPAGYSPKQKPARSADVSEERSGFSPKPKPCTTNKVYRLLFGNNVRLAPFVALNGDVDASGVTRGLVKKEGVPMAKPLTRKRMFDVL